jgi:undecaprenyl-diphosphatase
MAVVHEEPLRRIHQLEALEHSLVCRVAEEVGNRVVVVVLRVASRIGDWPLSVAVGLLLLATHGVGVMTLWTAASVGAVAIQTFIKRLFTRIRPCERPDGPPQRAPVPDKGSFPSGHTLHAVMGAVVISQLLPALTPLFVAIAVLVAVSRVALGVHYPSDVAAGGAFGAIFGVLLCFLV